MESGSVKRTSRDRLSELPDEVLVNILSFLPTLDAVKTVLLRRFGNLWTLVDTLSFSDCSFGNHIDAEEVNPVALSLFSKFVLNALLLHRRHTIKKFHIEIYQGIAEIEMWLRFALSREVNELTLNIYSWDRESCILRNYVFISQSLVSLELIGCSIRNLTRVHMESLRKLKFDHVKIDGETLEEIIYGSPSLEELVIHCNSEKLWITSANVENLKVRSWTNVTIDCPNLKMLYICANVHNVEIIDVSSIIHGSLTEKSAPMFLSSLSEAEVDIYGSLTEKSAPIFLSFLEKVGNADRMKLSYHTLHNLIYCSIKELVFPQNRWKHLILLSWIHGTDMLEIHKLLRSSLCLEELTIHADQHDEKFTRLDIDVNLSIAELSSPCELRQLKTVTIHGFQKGLLVLAEFILKSALNLEKLRFVGEAEELTPAEKLEYVMQVASFQRVSAKARVVFV